MSRRLRATSRRELIQMAGTGVVGLGVLQGTSPPRKQRFKDPTGTSPETLGAIRSGHLLFVSGVGGWYASRRPDGPGDIRQQTGDALDLMQTLLKEAGASMADLLQVQVALVDAERNWEAMNEVYNGPRSRAAARALLFRRDRLSDEGTACSDLRDCLCGLR